MNKDKHNQRARIKRKGHHKKRGARKRDIRATFFEEWLERRKPFKEQEQEASSDVLLTLGQQR